MYWSLVVFGFRNILRLFNFEEKEGSLIAQQLVCYLILQVLYSSFKISKTNKIVNAIIVLEWTLAQINSMQLLNFENFGKGCLTMVWILVLWWATLIYFKLIQSMVKYLIQYIRQAEDIQKELDQILENLEESILIMKDYKGEFVNQRFLELFSI